MKRLTYIFFSCVLIIFLSSCGKFSDSKNFPPQQIDPAEPTAKPTAEPAEEVNVIPNKIERNGFNKLTNSTYCVGNINFSIPTYYDTEKSNGSTTYLYAETGNSIVMLTLVSDHVDFGNSSFSSEDLDILFDTCIEGFLSTFEDVELLTSNDTLMADLPCRTIAFHCTLSVNDTTVSLSSRASFAFNVEENSVISIALGQQDNSKYSYFSDYEKIVQSAKPTLLEDEDTLFAPTDDIHPEFKQVMDSYEKFFDEYVSFMKKYESSDNPLEIFTDYLVFMTQYVETMEKLENMDTDDLSSAELAYYTEVMLRINQKLYALIS